MAIAGQAGPQLLAARFRFEWRPGTPIAAPTGRVAFRRVSDDGELLDSVWSLMAWLGTY